jgi:hypothetical protein
MMSQEVLKRNLTTCFQFTSKCHKQRRKLLGKSMIGPFRYPFVEFSGLNVFAGVETARTDAQPTDGNDAALIGGIVGGIVALLLMGGLIAFLVVRSRRNIDRGDSSNAMGSTSAIPSNYDRIPNLSDRADASSRKANEALYDDVDSVRQ